MTTTEQTQDTTTGGMWAPYEPPEIGEPLDVLEPLDGFVLVGAAIRENVKTDYGAKSAVDLRVQTTQPGETRIFSTFAKGIVGQVSRANRDNLPAVARIVSQTTSRGDTKVLALVSQLDPAADLAAVARGMTTPIAPIQDEH